MKPVHHALWLWLALWGHPLALALARDAQAQVVLPRAESLQAAAADPVELERLATRIGSARLLDLAGADKAPLEERRLALRALGLAGARDPEMGAYALLPLTQLIDRFGDRDREPEPEIRGAAVHAALLLIGALGGGTELPDEEPASDELPQAIQALLRLIGDGADQDLALAAVVALCQLTPVPAQVAERTRAQAANASLPRGERQRLVPCLRRLGTPPDRALINQLKELEPQGARARRRGGT